MMWQVRIFCALGLVCAAPAARAASARLEDATIRGSGGTLTITRMPVRLPGGTVFRDITIEFSVDDAGHVAIKSTTKPLAAPSAPPVIQHFLAGTYRSGDGSLVSVKDLGVPFGHDYPRWSLTAISGGELASATWSSGPVENDSLGRRLRANGVTSLAYSYGVSETGEGPFAGGAVIGVTETAKTLTFVSFLQGCCSVSPVPVAELRYRYVGR